MKKILTFALFFILTFNIYAQIKFEKGYFIDNNNLKTECLIQNLDWLNNPTKINYKLNESSEVSEQSINTIKEFSVNTTKYIRFSLNIDKSPEQINKLSTLRKPIFVNETLFLKVLIEGEANLYYYQENNLRRFFYTVSNKEIEQLIYKQYLTTDNIIKKNNGFKQQILNELKCPSISKQKIENLKYYRKDLIKYFIRFNDCKNSNYTKYNNEKEKKDLFNLYIRPGVNLSSIDISNKIYSYLNIDFPNKTNLRFGVEAEYILPFNKNKFAILLEPTYQYYKESDDVDYKSIELPIGFRYYLFLNDKSKIFTNISLVYDVPINSSIEDRTGDFEITSGINYAFGIGYNFNKKLSFEIRYLTTRDVLKSYLSKKSDYKTLSFIVGFNIL
ncbi:outer membrane beta-barrel protein [uncultured Formosa sp.]|uniref:outer membrane beta-barrel protein n=1 Tax=uncultured Formosa sp. TaxID=255435 RepID=UPI002611AA04|nr:outer membrane beta-barrel protein [uncultured Formosa sp.]